MTSNTPRRARAAFGLLVCAVLAACGGGDDDDATVNTVTATADTFTLAAGQTADLLANDRLGTATATVGTGGNVIFTVTSGALPQGITVTNGIVIVDGSAAPAPVSIGYRLCEAASTSNCATATAQITVSAPTIVAADDSFTMPIGAVGDLLANDTLGGSPATSATVNVTVTSALPTGILLGGNGTLTADVTVVPGSYSIGYQICQAAAPANCDAGVASIVVPTSGTLTGRAVDAATGVGVPDVQVSVGALSATTNADGGFTLNGVAPAARVAVRFVALTHAETVRIAEVSATQATDVQARMVAVGASATVPIDTASAITVPGSPARVMLPAAGVQRADGSLPTGNMTVRVTPIDPASDTSVMPGDFTTMVGGTPTPIESFGAMDVQMTDASGAALNLRPGQTATIRIPLSSRSSSPPATIPLFYFDAASGRWVEEGTATLAGTAPSRYYEGTVTHFTTWNADIVSETVLVSGCVADANGVRIVNAQVATDGIDYSGSTSARSDAGGNFSVPMRRSSQATMVAVSGGLLSNTLRIGPYDANTQLGECLALGQTGAGITMKLTWGALPSDLDSHLYLPDGTEVYYGNDGSLVSAPFANLDVDDTSSYGPEVITITKLMVGTYKYAIYNYSGYSSGPIGSASARVELNIPGRAAELFTPPATGESSATDNWNLFELDVDAQCNVSVRRVSTFTVSEPSHPTAAAVYCTR